MIREHVEAEKQLTIHDCSGAILIEDLMDAVKGLYDAGPTPNHLWDLTEADISQIKGQDLEELAKFAKEYAPTQMHGRTAIISNTDLGFGLARMYGMFAEAAGQSAQVGVFRSREEAEEWLSALSAE